MNIQKLILIIVTLVIIIFTLFFVFQTIEEKNENQTEKNDTTPINGETLFVGFSNDSYFKTIQDAINASSDNDTIFVENGTYNELLTINKTINLIGSSMNHTIIDYSSDNPLRQIVIINVKSDKCKIQNLTVTKSTNISDAIALYINSSNNIITNLLITNVSEGINLGINTNNNIIANNQILNNLIAIKAWRSCK